MTDPVLQEIAVFARERLTATASYCGVADGGDIAILNSTVNGKDVKITIETIEKEE